jgi:hypothetical protein
MNIGAAFATLVVANIAVAIFNPHDMDVAFLPTLAIAVFVGVITNREKA